MPKPSGHKMGWILSGVLVLALAGFATIALWDVLSPKPSEPTGAIDRPGFFEPIVVKVSPEPFLGGSFLTAPGDAADDYQQAVEFYRPAAESISDAMGHVTSKDDELAKGTYKVPARLVDTLEKIVAPIVAGAAKKEMHYTKVENITVRYANDQASQLVRVADAPFVLGKLYESQKRYEDAEKVFRAMFALGYHMVNEDVRASMTLQGFDVEGGGLGGLGDLYSEWDKEKHAAAMDKIQDYAHALEKAGQDYGKKLYVVWKLVPEPGDVFAVVQQDKDRAWRVEALLCCGAIRFTHANHEGNKRMIAKLIDQYKNDPDPFVKAAALAAEKLDEAGFKLVGTPPAK